MAGNRPGGGSDMRNGTRRHREDDGPRAIARAVDDDRSDGPRGAAWKAQLVLHLWTIALLTLIVQAALR